MHSFPSNMYGSTVLQVPYYTTHAQRMLHPHISREGASNDVKVLRTFWRHPSVQRYVIAIGAERLKQTVQVAVRKRKFRIISGFFGTVTD